MKFNYILKQIEESILVINNGEQKYSFEYANDHFLAKFDALIRSLLPSDTDSDDQESNRGWCSWLFCCCSSETPQPKSLM